MAKITLKGNPISTVGELPAVGSPAPDFLLTRVDLSDMTLADVQAKVKILNIVPSLDTGVCATSAKKFNELVKKQAGLAVVTVSRDLPFAQKRFCAAENVDAVITLSEMRAQRFGKDYGVEIADGPLAGLFSRAIVVVGADGKVAYVEQVPEIGQEPDYEKALDAAKKALSKAAGY
jgi:thiol peroxidase